MNDQDIAILDTSAQEPDIDVGRPVEWMVDPERRDVVLGVAIELKVLDHGVGRRGGVIGFEFVMGVHGMLHRLDRDRRGLHGDEKPTSGPVWQTEPLARASMAKPGYFASRCKGGVFPAGGK